MLYNHENEEKMPKLKSHSGAKKRFTKTASGKWKHRKAGRSHLLAGGSKKTEREMRIKGVLQKESPEGRAIAKHLPNK